MQLACNKKLQAVNPLARHQSVEARRFKRL